MESAARERLPADAGEVACRWGHAPALAISGAQVGVRDRQLSGAALGRSAPLCVKLAGQRRDSGPSPFSPIRKSASTTDRESLHFPIVLEPVQAARSLHRLFGPAQCRPFELGRKASLLRPGTCHCGGGRSHHAGTPLRLHGGLHGVRPAGAVSGGCAVLRVAAATRRWPDQQGGVRPFGEEHPAPRVQPDPPSGLLTCPRALGASPTPSLVSRYPWPSRSGRRRSE